MTFKAGRRLGLGVAALLLIAAWIAQTAAAQHWHHKRHHSRPNLDLRLAVSPVVAATGGQVTYTATITNRSRRNAAAAGFLDKIPRQTTFVSASASQGSCSGSTLVYCNVGALSGHTSATVTIVVT